LRYLLFFITLTSAVAYIVYVLFWRIRAVKKGIKGDLKNSVKFSGRSTDWVAWILLGAAVMAGILYINIYIK
jgi:hypothetical protein